MNASLRPLAWTITTAFERALQDLGISAPFYVSQNDGTLMSAAHMQRYPVLTFAAGPTNSLRGAEWLTGASKASVIDIRGENGREWAGEIGSGGRCVSWCCAT